VIKSAGIASIRTTGVAVMWADGKSLSNGDPKSPYYNRGGK